MSDRAFAFAQVLIFVVFIVVGLLALLLPRDKYRQLLGGLYAVGKSTKAGELQRRIVGLIFLLFGAYALTGQVSLVFNPKVAQQPPAQANPLSVGTNTGWLPFVLGTLVVAAGSFIALNPDTLVRWSQQRLFPGRQMPEEMLRTCRFALRTMGALMIYSSGDLFKLWVSH